MVQMIQLTRGQEETLHRLVTALEQIADHTKPKTSDKVMADLEESHKKEVGQLLILNKEQANAANRLRDNMEQVIRHNKYKRCLNEAKICQLRLERYERYLDELNCNSSTINRWRFLNCLYEKWHKHWLELAEKFKEAE